MISRLWPVLLLTACTSGLNPDQVWVRTDGQRITGNPSLARQIEVDKTVCQGEVAKTDAASVAPLPRRAQAADDVFAGCMAQKGYLFLSREEAERRVASAVPSR